MFLFVEGPWNDHVGLDGSYSTHKLGQVLHGSTDPWKKGPFDSTHRKEQIPPRCNSVLTLLLSLSLPAKISKERSAGLDATTSAGRDQHTARV